MSAGKHPRGLPPQYPQNYRRGSNSPACGKTVSETQLTPNRSRSLDGLLDSETGDKAAAQQGCSSYETPPVTQSCENILNNKEITQTDDEKSALNDSKFECNNATNENALEESTNSDDKQSSSTLSLHSNSSESKRKRNFMDRCVNKVRSLIKK